MSRTEDDVKLRTGSDVALAFVEGTAGSEKHVFWIGRVSLIYKRHNSGVRLYKAPVDLSEVSSAPSGSK